MANLKFQISNLSKCFANHQVLKSIDLDIVSERSMIILGGSGTGKSILIKCIVGLITPEEGSILYDGQETLVMSYKERLAMLEQCGYLFQAGGLFDSLTVQQNITFFAEKIYDLTKKDITDLAIQKLQSVGLNPEVLGCYPVELSGGMQKRVALARAVCTNPKVIFFDEPTTGLDPIMSSIINDLIIKLRDELGATTITITHDLHSARKIGDDIAFLYAGNVVWTGTVKQLDKTTNPHLKQFITS